MLLAHDIFIENIQRAQTMAGVFVALAKSTTQALDLTDLLRAAIVQSVSALDNLVHELVRVGIGQIMQGLRPSTPAYMRFKLSMQATMMLLANPKDFAPIDMEVRSHHSWQTFQRPDKVADAIRLITERHLWEEVAAQVGMPDEDVKTRLSTIIDRRDQIAHEADMDPTDPARQARWKIALPDAEEAIEFVHRIGNAIFVVVK